MNELIQDNFESEDDLSGSYLDTREQTDIRALEEQARAMLANKKPVEKKEEGRTVLQDMGRGALEIASGKAVASGLSKAANATLNLGNDIEDYLTSIDLDPPSLQVIDPKTGEFDFEFTTSGEFKKKLEEAGKSELLFPEVETDSVTGGLAAGIVQFLAGFAGAGKFIKAGKEASTATKIGVDAAKGAIADFTVFEGLEGRLTDLAAEHGFESELTDFLRTEEDDTALEGRLKNAVEGIIPGVLIDPLMRGVRGLRNANIERMDANKLAQTAEDAKKLADIEPELAKLDLGDAEAPAFEVKAEDDWYHGSPIAKDITEFTETGGGELGKGVYITKDQNLADNYSQPRGEVKNMDEAKAKAGVLKIKGVKLKQMTKQEFLDERAAFYDAEKELNNGEWFADSASKAEAKQQAKYKKEGFKGIDIPEENQAIIFSAKDAKIIPQAPAENAININLARLNTTDEVKQLIDDVAKESSGEINEARREAITFDETIKLADDLGMSVKQLTERRRGENYNAEELLAARRILISSGEQLTSLARGISEMGANVTPAELMKFQRALSQHKAIQAQVSGATAEAGRALSANRIIAKGAKEQQALIDEALNANGGTKVLRQKVEALANLKDPTQINAAARQMETASTQDMVYEAWINGLLTNPATHAANIISNSLVLLTSPMERKLASSLGRAIGDAEIPSGESSAMLYGMMKAMPDAFRVMANTFKTGIPASQIQKIENVQRKAITGANVESRLQKSFIGKGKKKLTGEDLNLNGTLGRGMDLFGEYARLPGRALSASDDFFQLLAYRSELNAQSYRQAVGEGLEGEELAARVQDLIANPPENIHSASSNFQHYATFTDEMGDIGKAYAGITRVPGGRIISPFIRTPSRVFAYSMERTPISFALGKGNAGVGGMIRDDIMAGGARRDMALAKMAGGSMIMAMGAELAMNGLVTGSGPQDPAAKKIWREKFQPNSIRIGNEWVSYSRLDPIAMPMGIAAEMTEILGELDDAEASDLAMAAVIGTSKSLMSKSFVKGQSDLYEAILSASVDPEANNFKSRRIIENLVGSTVPSGVAAVARKIDPELKETYDPDNMYQMINRIKSRLPGWSKDLKPRLNLYGDPIVLGGGLGPDILSPIYTNDVKSDPVTDEIIAQKIPLRFPSKNINGVPLTSDEYYQLQLLTAKQRVSGKDLKQSFSAVMKRSAYKKGTREMKELMIQTVYNNHKAAARAKLMQETRREPNGILKRIEAKKREDKNKLKGLR